MAIPTFASSLTIIGPGCLTTVFGMGTGVTTTVWSPKKYVAPVGTTHLVDLVKCKRGMIADCRMSCDLQLATPLLLIIGGTPPN
jgi:hypothetical protein